MSRFIIVFLLFISVNIFGQEAIKEEKKETKKIDFKLYSNFDYSPRYISYGVVKNIGFSTQEYRKEIQGLYFSPTLVLYNKQGNSFEYEISRLRYNNSFFEINTVNDSTGSLIKIVDGEHRKEFELFLRFEYKILLFNKEYWRILKPYLGFSATPFITWNKKESKLNSVFPTSETVMGITLSAIPRIEYIINEKWYLDFNIPISIININYSIFKNNNPTITTNQRKERLLDFYNMPIGFAVRLGLGYRF